MIPCMRTCFHYLVRLTFLFFGVVYRLVPSTHLSVILCVSVVNHTILHSPSYYGAYFSVSVIVLALCTILAYLLFLSLLYKSLARYPG